MLPDSKKTQLLNDLKNYKKKYEKYTGLDESGTRIMINEFLTDILGFKSLDEVKTEYMIKGTYADYVVQVDGKRHFLVEVKAMEIELSDKHLRQAVNYAANEGIEWALLTNGKHFELYKIIFGQPIDSKLVFQINMEDFKAGAESIQYLVKSSVLKGGLDVLWNKVTALDPNNISSMLCTSQIVGIIKKELKAKYKVNFEEEDVLNAIIRVCEDCVADVKIMKEKKKVIAVKPKPEIIEPIQNNEGVN
jgi:hypothetical protein